MSVCGEIPIILIVCVIYSLLLLIPVEARIAPSCPLAGVSARYQTCMLISSKFPEKNYPVCGTDGTWYINICHIKCYMEEVRQKNLQPSMDPRKCGARLAIQVSDHHASTTKPYYSNEPDEENS